MKQYELIQKNEASLWRELYEHVDLSEGLAIFFPDYPDVPNFNQVFWWGPEMTTSQLQEIKSLYIDRNCEGYLRKQTNDFNFSPLQEAYIVTSPDELIKKASSPVFELEITSETEMDANEDFGTIFMSAFGFSEQRYEDFKKKIKGVSDKMPSRFFVGYHEGAPVSVGSIFESKDFWFFMNFGTPSHLQNNGYGKALCLQLFKDFQKPVVA